MLSWRQRVRDLEAENKFLREKLAQFERLLKSYKNPHTPSSKTHKKNTERDESKPRFPGKPKGGNGGGMELPPPDKVEEHTLDACPDCDGKLQMKSMALKCALEITES